MESGTSKRRLTPLAEAVRDMLLILITLAGGGIFILGFWTGDVSEYFVTWLGGELTLERLLPYLMLGLLFLVIAFIFFKNNYIVWERN